MGNKAAGGPRRWIPAAVAAVALALGLPAAVLAAGLNWGAFAFASVAGLLLAVVLAYEKSGPNARETALVASLGAVAAAGRIPFAVLPGVQPVTFICILSGMVFGARTGFAVGALAAALSNFALGQGPWTPWQMLAWGLAGATAGWMRGPLARTGRPGLAAFGVIWGYLFGLIVNMWVWTSSFYPVDLRSLLAVEATSLAFDTAHAAGNAVFALLLGREARRVLERFRARITVEKT
ncbi:MAG: ECF transporter S component [Thermoanaerobacterales bacterium]|nr:ECF transporter S component [Thermoanaerobacterales bacterium]